MSLRKSPELTPALLAAARSNAQHSTGPRSASAKQNVKLNALKHGVYARDENRHKTMLALGEDPEKLQTLTEEFMTTFGSGDALYQKQVEDLAWLYSRRDRLERVQDGLRRRALQAIDDWQHHRQQEMARVTFDSSQHVMIDVDLPDSTDRGVMLRKTISYLELVREEVKQRTFRQRQYSILEDLYRGLGIKGWRMGLIFRLLHRFGDPIQIQRPASGRGMEGVPAQARGQLRRAGRAGARGVAATAGGGNRQRQGRIRICGKGERGASGAGTGRLPCAGGGDVGDAAAPGSLPGPLD